jgi:PucR C-terminal helix-turn-helix domain
VAWRRLAGAARRAELDAGVISALAESIFAYIEELSADSVEGYAQERSQQEGERQRRRRELVGVLLRDPPADAADVTAAADAAAWSVPRSAAALACPEDHLDRVVRRLPAEALGTLLRGVGCVILPDPAGPGRGAQIAQAAGGGPAVLGPAGPVAELSESWSLARSALRAREAGALSGDGLTRVEERLADLLVYDGRRLAERIADRRLASFAGLTPKARGRMEETLFAYLRQQGNAAAMAGDLGVHPQTARYRLARLRELLDGTLDDPDARFELELALRAGRSS